MNTARDLIGRTFQGKFVITDVLGEGAMGIVYRGFDDATLDEVAIKVLQPSLAGNEDLVRRFHREASATRRVDSEGTVRVLGRGCEEGLYFLVMELLHGKSLAAVLTETRRLPEGRAARLVIQLCGALQVAHERGVIHRDIKPDNIMVIDPVGGDPTLTGGGDPLGERVKLLDFGIAKRLAQPDQRVEDSFNSGAETRFGALLGTPEYMAPEQCMGRDVDQRTDIYACGVLLYRMVTGQVPFDGTDAHPFELCQRHIGEEPARPRAIVSWLRPEMEAIILKALSKSPDARHQTAVELRGELAQILASIEEIEMEPTAPVVVDRLVRADQATLLAEDFAAVVSTGEMSPDLPTLVLEPVSGASAEPFVLLPPDALSASPVATTLVEIPEPLAELVAADLHPPVPTTRQGRKGVRLPSYLTTVALAAVIGAGLGSLFMVLAPLVQR